MTFSMKNMLHPGDMAHALFLPFVRVTGAFTLLLAAFYLLVGVDPTVPVSRFVVDPVTASLPLVGRFSAVWALYTFAYLLLGACRHDLWVIALVLDRLPGAAQHFELSFLSVMASNRPLAPFAAKFSAPLWIWPSGYLRNGWVRGLSPKLE